MKSIYDIAVIGGGASGMMAAIAGARQKSSVILLEHNDRLGKKILQTGNGRCNLTNHLMNEDCYGMENAQFAMNVIKDFDENMVMKFFSEIGLLLHDRNGYVYPLADQATQVNDLLYQEINRLGIKVSFETNVTSIQKEDLFVIKTSNGIIKAKSVIIATGSKAYPKSGSDGSGYTFAKSFGHRIITPLPALTALLDDSRYHKTITGVRCDANLTLHINKKKCIAERGELQLTDYGLSGIPIFQISRYAVKALENGQSVECYVDFMPDYSKEEIIQFLSNKKCSLCCSYREYFNGLINKKIMEMILNLSKLNPNDICSNVSTKQFEQVASYIKNYHVNFTGYKSFDYGQVCQGGVDVASLNPTTLESKLVKGLFFCGEVVDIDGKCGGYNLQWAWSSGYKAGVNAGK